MSVRPATRTPDGAGVTACPGSGAGVPARLRRDGTVQSAKSSRRATLFVYLLFLALTIACFYSGEYFYYWDEWDAMYAMTQQPIHKLLFVPHNEHLMPVHRLFFWMQTSLVGERYALHVLLNCALHALNACVLLGILRDQRLHAAVAGIAALAYLLTYAQWDNLGIAFQSQVFLCTLFALLALRIVLRPSGAGAPSVIVAAILSVLSAWSFGGGLVVAPLLAAFVVLDWLVSRKRRTAPAQSAPATPEFRSTRLWPAALFIVVCLGLVAAYLGFGGARPAGPSTAIGSILEAPSTGESLSRAGRLAAATLNAAFYAPLWIHLAECHKHLLMPGGQLLASTVFVLVCVVLARDTPRRVFVLKMLLFQAAVFFLIAVARMDLAADACFADRYQTLGLIGVVATLAAVIQSLIESPAIWRKGVSISLLTIFVLAIARNVRMDLRRRPDNAARRGTVIREDYFGLKRDMTADRESFPNVLFTRHGHPGLTAERLARVMEYLDSDAASHLPKRFTPVEYDEQRRNTRPWGHILGTQGPEQTLHFLHDSRINRVELWFATGGKKDLADCRIAILDEASRVLHEAALRGNFIFNNLWTACPMPGVQVEAGKTYRLRIRSTAEKPDRGFTLWMSADSNAWPHGDTTAEDGSLGDLCFSIAYSRVREE